MIVLGADAGAGAGAAGGLSLLLLLLILAEGQALAGLWPTPWQLKQRAHYGR